MADVASKPPLYAEDAFADPVRWDRLSWSQLADRQKAGPGLVVLPVGATEQHGPALPTGTDNTIVTALSHYASGVAGVPVLPTLSFGVSVGHTHRWPGTVSLLHETLALAVREMVGWLLADGWARILLVNSHFGNDAALRIAVDRLRTDHLGELQIGLINTYRVSPAVWADFTADADDLHANRAETDLMLYLDPEACDLELLRAGAADDDDRTAGTVFSYPVALTSTNGVTGKPSQATAKRGRALFLEMGNALADLLEQAKTETPPLTFRTDPLT
ncbi:MAG: creatininase family protein [Planctomycetota bacterium]